MLRLENIQAHYGKMKALEDITMEVKESEIVTIIGANGAGKTTTLRTIFGLLRPTRGSVIFKGEAIEKEPYHLRARRGISLVPEGGRAFSKLTVLENLEMGAFIREEPGEVRKDVEMVFGMFPVLGERQKSLAGTLSGGERQMLALGRCLMLRPTMALLDEPSLGLGPLVLNEVYEKIKEIRRSGVTILLVEQNAKKALQTADRGYVYQEGRITLSDTSSKLYDNEHVKKIFLGE